MRVLVLEDDVLMQELLATLLRGLDSNVQVLVAETVDVGLALWRQHRVDLLLCDWNLSGHRTGLELIKTIRSEDAEVPILVITGQGDRVTVTQSARYHVNEFIIKPFDAKAVMERLRRYVIAKDLSASTPKPVSSLEDLIAWAGTPEKVYERLAIMSGTNSALELLNQPDKPSVRELANLWKADAVITARLLRLANSSLMRRYGTSVANLLEAVGSLGVDMAVSQVVAISLRNTDRLKDSYLQELSEKYALECSEVADQAAALAKQLKLNITLCYTAGLLMRLGEFALLDAIQQFIDTGKQVAPADIDACVSRLAARYGNFLKVKWHLPISLRERIGATYLLPEGSVNAELIVMRIAACMVHQHTQTPAFGKLCGQIGISPAVTSNPAATSKEKRVVSGHVSTPSGRPNDERAQDDAT